MLTFFLWLVVGTLTGLLAKAAVPGTNDEARGPMVTTTLGVLGAIVAGLIYQFLTRNRIDGIPLDTGSLGWAAIGAIVVVIIAGMLGVRKVF